MKVTQAFCAGLLVPVLVFSAPIVVRDERCALGHPAAELALLPEQPRAFAPATQQAVPDHRIDVYGNEVSSAVSEYRMDAAGSLYELHAPQVEIPRLTSPKS